MEKNTIIFLCPTCFRLCEDKPLEGHDHKMIRLDTASLTQELRKPLFDPNGHMVSRAPLWFLKEIGVIAK